MSNPEFTNEELEAISAIYEARKEALKQVVWGFLWWFGSTVAMYYALGSTSNGILWFGGALGAVFHWYRAFKIFRATFEVGIKKFFPIELVSIVASALLVVVSTSLIVPEWVRSSTPQIGTCWGQVDSGQVTPVACWSQSVIGQTVGFADSEDQCPTEADSVLPPDSTETRVTCIKSR